MPLQKGVNIIVGDNEAGKSTILEAVNLCLSGYLGRRSLRYELSQYLFNNTVVKEYLSSLFSSIRKSPPKILIQVFFATGSAPRLEGNLNYKKTPAEGVSLSIEFDEEYAAAYQSLLASGEPISSIPIEYYKVVWKGFCRESVTASGPCG